MSRDVISIIISDVNVQCKTLNNSLGKFGCVKYLNIGATSILIGANLTFKTNNL